MTRLALIAALLFALPAQADPAAETFVRTTADEFIAVLVSQPTLAGREAGFRKLLSAHVNMERVGRFTLGTHARRIAPDDFRTYKTLLRDLLVKVYAGRLGDYGDETIEVLGSQSKRNNVIVSSRIVFADAREPISVDWWLVREKDGRLTLFDLRVLGIWMVQEQRAAFASVLGSNRGNIAALLDYLRVRVENGTSG